MSVKPVGVGRRLGCRGRCGQRGEGVEGYLAYYLQWLAWRGTGGSGAARWRGGFGAFAGTLAVGGGCAAGGVGGGLDAPGSMVAPCPVGVAEVGLDDAARRRCVYHAATAYVEADMVDLASVAEEYEVARLEVGTVDAPAVVALLRAGAGQAYAEAVGKYATGESRAVDSAALVAAVAVGRAEPAACLLYECAGGVGVDAALGDVVCGGCMTVVARGTAHAARGVARPQAEGEDERHEGGQERGAAVHGANVRYCRDMTSPAGVKKRLRGCLV